MGVAVICYMRPLDHWPFVLRVNREPSPFRSEWPETRGMLCAEARKLNRQSLECNLYVAARDRDITRESKLLSGWKATHPGVHFTCAGPHGTDLSFYCDRYQTWQANARAIALTLRALRAVDRYGVAAHREHPSYIGFITPQLEGATND